MEFLESIREEACAGMDAFDTVMELEAQSEAERVIACSAFLMQVLERMANRLEGFYSKLTRYSVFRPEMENNPARARWNILKRKIKDGSFFILTRKASMGAMPAYNNQRTQDVDFDHVVNHIQHSLDSAPTLPSRNMNLTEQHFARAEVTPNGGSAYEQNQNTSALKAMSSFMDRKKRDIRRLSKLPQAINLEQLMQTYGSIPQPTNGLPTPPSSRSSSRSPSTSAPLVRRNTTVSAQPMPGQPQLLQRRNTATSDRSMSPTTPHVSPAAALQNLMTNMKMNSRMKPSNTGLPSPPQSANEMADRIRSMQSFNSPRATDAGHARAKSTTGSLRSFRLQASAMAGGMNRRGDGH